MTLVVFLIDTSASMNQRTFPYRCSLLDVAKESVEKFIKVINFHQLLFYFYLFRSKIEFKLISPYWLPVDGTDRIVYYI